MAITTDIDKAVQLLLEGALVALPTETVYGLGANALDINAVAKVFEAKNRPSFDPLIVHVASIEQAQEVAELNDAAIALFKQFSPGPLTLVLPKKEVVPDLVTSGHPTVAIRIPNHPMTLEVIRKSGLCIAAPSANPFGYTSPTTAAHVQEQLGDKIDAILDGGPCGWIRKHHCQSVRRSSCFAFGRIGIRGAGICTRGSRSSNEFLESESAWNA